MKSLLKNHPYIFFVYYQVSRFSCLTHCLYCLSVQAVHTPVGINSQSYLVSLWNLLPTKKKMLNPAGLEPNLLIRSSFFTIMLHLKVFFFYSAYKYGCSAHSQLPSRRSEAGGGYSVNGQMLSVFRVFRVKAAHLSRWTHSRQHVQTERHLQRRRSTRRTAISHLCVEDLTITEAET